MQLAQGHSLGWPARPGWRWDFPGFAADGPAPQKPLRPGRARTAASLRPAGPRGRGRGPRVSRTFAPSTRPGVPRGHSVSETRSVAALALTRPPGTRSTARLCPDGSHKATLSPPEVVTLGSALKIPRLWLRRESGLQSPPPVDPPPELGRAAPLAFDSLLFWSSMTRISSSSFLILASAVTFSSCSFCLAASSSSSCSSRSFGGKESHSAA